eukprot:XP_001708178.1 Hypothetical protein GL50803_89798 [Giardia lamblia ATCC 50803]
MKTCACVVARLLQIQKIPATTCIADELDASMSPSRRVVTTLRNACNKFLDKMTSKSSLESAFRMLPRLLIRICTTPAAYVIGRS